MKNFLLHYLKEVILEVSQLKRSFKVKVIFCACVLVLSIGLSLSLGRYSVSTADIKNLWHYVLDQGQRTSLPPFVRVVWKIRLPRIIANIFVGTSLAVSGTVYQALFDNPMASPNVLGVSSGASFGAALALLLYASHLEVLGSAFIFGLVCVASTYFVSRFLKFDPTLSLILSGMVISSTFQAGVSYLKLIADENNRLPAITYWMLGSFSSVTWHKLMPLIPAFITGLVLIYYYRSSLNILSLGTDKAQTVGLNVRYVRTVLIFAATLLTTSSVALTGMIGWVGLVIPHIVRIVIGSNYRYLISLMLFVGAIFMILIDTMARIITATEIPIGILTALMGAPVYLILLLKGENFHDFKR